jgi:hypothetical protein
MVCARRPQQSRICHHRLQPKRSGAAVAFGIDYNLTIGSVAEIISIIAGGLIFLGVMRRALKDMEKDLDKMQQQIQDLSKAMIQIAVQNERIGRIEEDFRDLRRGRGWILDKDDKR